MATLGKGTLLLSMKNKYGFTPSDYEVSDLVVGGPRQWETVGDNKTNILYAIAQIYSTQVGNTSYNLVFGNDNSHSHTANLLTPNAIDFSSDSYIEVGLGYATAMVMDRTNSTDGLVVGDLFYNILKAAENCICSAYVYNTTDSYGNKIDCIIYSQSQDRTSKIATSCKLTFTGAHTSTIVTEHYQNGGIQVFPVVPDQYKITQVTDVLGTEKNSFKVLTIENVPEKPTWSGPYSDDAGKYWTINTNSRRKGNIYMNGAPEPSQTWTDGETGPWSYKFYPKQAGAYTANTISTVPLYSRDVYSELSETLIVENEVVDIQISFNEYTGTLTATAPTGSYSVYKLMKKAGEGYGQVGENTTGIFQITESGTYRVECDAKPLFVVNPSQPITVETTLDTPNAYVEFSNPSQLGFDEVENANVYDIYRVSDDGEEDELVESVTVGPSMRARSVRRAEKIFRVVIEE
jgi:hypothetical protein